MRELARQPYARVYLLDVPYHIDRIFEYYLPEDFREEVYEGSFVSVPFGAGNRSKAAVVFGFADTVEIEAEKVKSALGVINTSLRLNEEMRGLALFLADHTFCTVGEAVRAMLPGAAFDGLVDYYSAVTDAENDGAYGKSLSGVASDIYLKLKKDGKMSVKAIKQRFGKDAEKALHSLVRRGVVRRETQLRESSNIKYTECLSLSEEFKASPSSYGVRGAKLLEIIRYLTDKDSVLADEIKNVLSVSSSQIKNLCDKGILKIERFDKYRNPYGDGYGGYSGENILSAEQSEARDKICELYNTHQPKAALLHGITGSGKTRVIKSVIDEVLRDGRSVIVLVPEISLTPQTVGIFVSYYKDRIAVVHSSLSQGERLDAWRRMKNGEADICIGTRSAIFAPFENLGMIVIDEEQEHTYKSDMAPKYHAKDVARYRCAHQNALMLLSSATPSLESYYKAQSGAYTLVELTKRYGGATLPETVIADMREESAQGNLSPVGDIIREHIFNNIKNGEQSILFINRRGYNNFLTCTMCGNVIMCPHCSVSLTYHSRGDREGEHNGYLFCHYCGYRERVPQQCPECASEHIRYVGYGTQKVEQELSELFEGRPMIRMDADTTSGKFSYESILDSFRRGQADILLGTQMVAKGHDFPNVTLVGVMNADSAFYLDDYRANERTFSLLTQVIGRAGRADKKGRAVIQTYNPEHPVLKLACEQDYKTFYKNEIELRRALVFPPYCDIVMLTLTSEDESALLHTVQELSKRIREMLSGEYNGVVAEVFGPIEAPLYRINGKYRMRFVIKCRANSKTRAMLRQLLCEYGKRLTKTLNLAIDVNPNSI